MEVAEADWYVWALDPSEAGELAPDGNSVTISWNPGFSGNAALSVHGENDCGTGPESDPLELSVSLSPDPEISGPQNVTPGSEEQYQTEENPENTYTWEVTGGTVTAGEGTHQVSVLWGGSGEGSLTVMEETTEGCSEITDPYPVDIIVSIEENYPGNIRIYPNPADETIQISFNNEIAEAVLISISTLEGKVVYSSKFEASEGENRLQVITANLPEGMYMLKMNNGRPGRLVIVH